jgi:hypothetical protein
MRAYYCDDPQRVTEPKELICRGTERECRRAAAKALGKDTLRGCPQYQTRRGIAYCAPGYSHYPESAPSVELVP